MSCQVTFSSVPGCYGKPASGSARSLLVGDVLELVVNNAGGASGSRALVTVHRVAEVGSMGHSLECAWQRGETESMEEWARSVFCRGESNDRGHVHLCTKRRLPHRRPRLALLRMARGSARRQHPTWVGFEEAGPTPSVRRGDTREEEEPHERTTLGGQEGPPLFPPINPLAVAAGELEDRRRRGSNKKPDSRRSPGENGDATPRIGKRCPRSPSRRHSSSQGHKQRKSDCRLRRRLASVVKEYHGIREELGCGQSARHKMLMTVAERTMQQVMLLEARNSKRRKHNRNQRGNGEQHHHQRVVQDVVGLRTRSQRILVSSRAAALWKYRSNTLGASSGHFSEPSEAKW